MREMSPDATDARVQTILRGPYDSLSVGRPAARDAHVVALLERVAGALRRTGTRPRTSGLAVDEFRGLLEEGLGADRVVSPRLTAP
jgi:hypothetical protein